MFTKAEHEQMLRERVADHLIDNDDYFNLNIDRLEDFLDWSVQNASNYTDIEGVDIDQMFADWCKMSLVDA